MIGDSLIFSPLLHTKPLTTQFRFGLFSNLSHSTGQLPPLESIFLAAGESIYKDRIKPSVYLLEIHQPCWCKKTRCRIYCDFMVFTNTHISHKNNLSVQLIYSLIIRYLNFLYCHGPPDLVDLLCERKYVFIVQDNDYMATVPLTLLAQN